MIKVAILVDGGFYRQNAYRFFGVKGGKERADELEQYCKLHLYDKKETRELYRIFYYDCPPISSKVYHPLTKKQIDLGKSELNLWMREYIKELTHRRKFCMRMGMLAEKQARYNLRPEITKKLLEGSIKLEDIKEIDFQLNLPQKGVDMKIGVDISSLAYKRQVDQIILISGDSDFVPAAKLARREGIDFILDPMLSHVKDDLYEHIDGIRSKVNTLQKSLSKKQNTLPMNNSCI